MAFTERWEGSYHCYQPSPYGVGSALESKDGGSAKTWLTSVRSDPKHGKQVNSKTVLDLYGIGGFKRGVEELFSQDRSPSRSTM